MRPYTPKSDDVVSECLGPEGVVAYAREGVERWLGENAIYHCGEGVLVPSDTGRSLVLIQDAGAGRGVTRRAAQVVLYTLAAMPWQAIVTKKTAKLTGKITVQVGW